MSKKIFKRKIYERMLQCKQVSDGQTALLIKGARRIGKSAIAEEFARREYDSYINIDFSIADAAVKELFSHISDLDYVFLRIQSLFNVHCMDLPVMEQHLCIGCNSQPYLCSISEPTA